MSKDIRQIIMWEYNNNLYKDKSAAISAAFRDDNPYYQISLAQSKMDIMHNRLSWIDKVINNSIHVLKTEKLSKLDKYKLKVKLYEFYIDRINSITNYRELKKEYYELLRLYKEENLRKEETKDE